VLIPIENEKDLSEISDEIKEGLSIKPVQWIDEVLDIALATPPGDGKVGDESVGSSGDKPGTRAPGIGVRH